MTKKVISIIFLIVTSLIFATSVFADYVGVPTTNFDIVFNKVVPNSFTISVIGTDVATFSDDTESSTSMGTLVPNTSLGLNYPQCKIVVSLNFKTQMRLIFNPFYNTDGDTIPYKITLWYGSSYVSDKYTSLNVESDNTGASDDYYFELGNKNGTLVDYTYPLAFEFNQSDFDNAAPGDYEAEIYIEVLSNE